MADVTVNLQDEHVGNAATMSVDGEQDMTVAHCTDESCKKKAKDLVPGDYVYHGKIRFKVVAPPE